MDPKLRALLTVLVAFACCVPAPAAAATPVASGTIYGGQTSQHNPFVLRLSVDREHVAKAMLYVDAPCTDGKRVTVNLPARFVAKAPRRTVVDVGDNVFFGRALSKPGAFAADGLSSADYGYATANIREHLTANVHGRSAAGTYRA